GSSGTARGEDGAGKVPKRWPSGFSGIHEKEVGYIWCDQPDWIFEILAATGIEQARVDERFQDIRREPMMHLWGYHVDQIHALVRCLGPCLYISGIRKGLAPQGFRKHAAPS